MRIFKKTETQHQVSWNKGKLVGQKPPLQPKHVWAIRTRLQLAKRGRDLALFNLAIDSKLRGCDVVSLTVEDIAPHGYAVERASVRQKKTGRPVKFEITEHSRQAVDEYLKTRTKRPGKFLFTGRRGPDKCLTTRQYARLVSQWIASIGLDASLFGTHSLRRTKATLIYRRTGNLTKCNFHGIIETREVSVARGKEDEILGVQSAKMPNCVNFLHDAGLFIKGDTIIPGGRVCSQEQSKSWLCAMVSN